MGKINVVFSQISISSRTDSSNTIRFSARSGQSRRSKSAATRYAGAATAANSFVKRIPSSNFLEPSDYYKEQRSNIIFLHEMRKIGKKEDKDAKKSIDSAILLRWY